MHRMFGKKDFMLSAPVRGAAAAVRRAALHSMLFAAACAGLAVASATAVPSRAAAIVEVYTPAAYDKNVKLAEILGHQYVVSIGNGFCHFIYVGNTSGLTDDVWLITSSNQNFIHFVEASYNECGYTLDPVKLNGHSVFVIAGAGNDNISGPTNSSGSWFFGEAGNDRITSRVSGGVNTQVYGGDGNDTLFPLGNAVEAHGGNGDDLFCLNRVSPPAAIALGEAGSDTRCGAAVSMSSIENSNCNNTCIVVP